MRHKSTLFSFPIKIKSSNISQSVIQHTQITICTYINRPIRVTPMCEPLYEPAIFVHSLSRQSISNILLKKAIHYDDDLNADVIVLICFSIFFRTCSHNGRELFASLLCFQWRSVQTIRTFLFRSTFERIVFLWKTISNELVFFCVTADKLSLIDRTSAGIYYYKTTYLLHPVFGTWGGKKVGTSLDTRFYLQHMNDDFYRS